MNERSFRSEADRRASGLLLGRDHEITRLASLLDQARIGRGGALVVSGDAGVGKTALLDHVTGHPSVSVRVERITASESEIGLPFAGLQLMCGHLLTESTVLPPPQREALETAFGLRTASAPNPLVLGLAIRTLLTHVAADRGLLCVVDDAQWLDEVSARALASVARRLGTEGVAIVLAMREVHDRFADLPQLRVEGLDDADARKLLRAASPGPIDQRVHDQLIAEARGNPLALHELPAALSPADLAGGFALPAAIPLERRIEDSLLTQLDLLPDRTRTLLLLAAADPTGDPGLLWRASATLGLDPADADPAVHADALVVAQRVRFRHPLIRSSIYRAASPEARRQAHSALADATLVDQDPDRRAWHRARAAVLPDEDVAGDLERLAARARARGGVAAAAAFLERAAELTPDSAVRADRLIAAAGAKLDAGAPETALQLLDNTRLQHLTAYQDALCSRLRARARYALRRDRGAPRQLLEAAKQLEPHDPTLARDTYMEALSAAVYAGRLGEPGAVQGVASAILAATANDDANESAQAPDLILRGQALLSLHGQAAALSTVRRAVRAFLDQPSDAVDLHWMWFAGRAAQDIWDADAMRTLAARQVELARAGGVLTVLPMALNLLMVTRTFDGYLDEAEAICDDIDTILSITGHPLPPYGRIFVAAYRGRVEEVERATKQVRADAQARGEGYALTAANLAEALVYNGAGRYPEALAAAREEMPYAHELGHAMRTLLEVVESAIRTGDLDLAEEAVERLREVTDPAADSDWARAIMAMAEAQVREGDEAEALYRTAIEGFGRVRVPMLQGRSHLLYGEMLRRANRRVDARKHLRAAYDLLRSSGMDGFADRANRELHATGERLRQATAQTAATLTDQEDLIAGLASQGLTNRDIGAQLFLSAHTVEWHLRKVYTKLDIKSRRDLTAALADRDGRSTTEADLGAGRDGHLPSA